MLITAKVARNQTSNKGRKEYKNSYIRELRKVEIAINLAAKKGKTSIQCHWLYSKVCNIIENNGYVVRRCGFMDQKWVVISWDEPN